MKYMKTSELEPGRQIAKPIYNRQGVTLYTAGSKVDDALIHNFREQEIYGTYVLDFGEPVPVMSDDEMYFERFQSVETFTVNDILTGVVKGKSVDAAPLVDKIFNQFGFLNRKIIFHQSIRSEKDFISKHSLNVSMLCAMISDKMGFDNKEKKYLIEAALYHDVGKLLMPKKILHKQGRLTNDEMTTTYKCLLEGFGLLGENYSYPAGVRRYVLQQSKELQSKLSTAVKVDKELPGTKILKVADIYDTLTAIRPYKDPVSAFAALKIIREESDRYDIRSLEALESCLNLLPVGSYVNLSNGEQAIVIAENPKSLMHPRVLSLTTNQMIDLDTLENRRSVTITDTVFTQDNRQKVIAEKVKDLVSKTKAEMK